jgi:hypothetical protein
MLPILPLLILAISATNGQEFEIYNANEPTELLVEIDKALFMVNKSELKNIKGNSIFKVEGNKFAGTYGYICSYGLLKKFAEMCKIVKTNREFKIVPKEEDPGVFQVQKLNESICLTYRKDSKLKREVSVENCNGGDNKGTEFIFVNKKDIPILTDENGLIMGRYKNQKQAPAKLDPWRDISGEPAVDSKLSSSPRRNLRRFLPEFLAQAAGSRFN